MGGSVNGFREGSHCFESVQVLLPVAERAESAILRLSVWPALGRCCVV